MEQNVAHLIMNAKIDQISQGLSLAFEGTSAATERSEHREELMPFIQRLHGFISSQMTADIYMKRAPVFAGIPIDSTNIDALQRLCAAFPCVKQNLVDDIDALIDVLQKHKETVAAYTMG